MSGSYFNVPQFFTSYSPQLVLNGLTSMVCRISLNSLLANIILIKYKHFICTGCPGKISETIHIIKGTYPHILSHILQMHNLI